MDEKEDQLQNQDKSNVNDKMWQDSNGMKGAPATNPKPNKDNLIGKEAIPQILELARVDIRIENKDNDSNNVIEDPTSIKEDPYYIIDQGKCRGLDEKGIVANPGVGDEWIIMQVYDKKNERNLEIRFKAYLQVPKF